MTKPVLLSQGMVDKALTDPAFYVTVPEFSQLRGHKPVKVGERTHGCRGCGSAKAQMNLFNNFVLLAGSISTEAIVRLKRYFGVANIMMNVFDPNTKQVKVKLI